MTDSLPEHPYREPDPENVPSSPVPEAKKMSEKEAGQFSAFRGFQAELNNAIHHVEGHKEMREAGDEVGFDGKPLPTEEQDLARFYERITATLGKVDLAIQLLQRGVSLKTQDGVPGDPVDFARIIEPSPEQPT